MHVPVDCFTGVPVVLDCVGMWAHVWYVNNIDIVRFFGATKKVGLTVCLLERPRGVSYIFGFRG